MVVKAYGSTEHYRTFFGGVPGKPEPDSPDTTPPDDTTDDELAPGGKRR
jgi:hypothetical protein